MLRNIVQQYLHGQLLYQQHRRFIYLVRFCFSNNNDHKHHSFSALGLLILPQTWSYVLYGETLYRPWRLLMVTYKIPGFIALTILYFLKESPRYYLSKVFSFIN